MYYHAHTIIDPDISINIPGEHLVWGFIKSEADLKDHTIAFDDLAEVRDILKIGKLTFTGMGSVFIDSFRKRIHQILLLNGALFQKGENRGHAQNDQNISFNTIQPYRTGAKRGLYPSIRIKP